ncbi:MAG: haloacid dehalogenase-like hydrolase [Methanothrix sp.]|nr:haloacid dehalogenase-like hydrolase [Methanothrix sp.]
MKIYKVRTNIGWIFCSIVCLLLLSCGIGFASDHNADNANGQRLLDQSSQIKSQIKTDLTNKTAEAGDPLSSWNSGTSKTAIFNFLANVTNSSNPGYVSPDERIAVIDNDGTLICEKPDSFQFLFISDRVKELAHEHPEWKSQEPFSSLLSGNRSAEHEFSSKENEVMKLATNANVTVEEYMSIVGKWMNTTKHPRFKIPYDRCVYKPMTELISLLKAKDFKVYVVTGSYADFLRAFSKNAYGILPEQVIGSNNRNRFIENNMTTDIVILPEIWNKNSGIDKAQDIWLFIGHRPIFAYGNSDGDIQMLQYATGKNHTGIALFNRHDDSIREYAYDRNATEGKLDKGLDISPAWDWHIVSMKNDWKTVF